MKGALVQTPPGVTDWRGRRINYRGARNQSPHQRHPKADHSRLPMQRKTGRDGHIHRCDFIRDRQGIPIPSLRDVQWFDSIPESGSKSKNSL